MLYNIFFPLSKYFFGFNVFQYITFRAGGAILTALLLNFIVAPAIIRKLKEFQICQKIREDGPLTHLLKAGTPTMGGLIILLTLLVSTLLWARLDNRFIWLMIFSTMYLGLLGFIDDYLKIVRKKTFGLSSSMKMFWLLVFAIIVSGYLYMYPSNYNFSTSTTVPYLKETYLKLGIFYIFFMIFVIIGTTNAVNLTDGLDGLAIGSIVFSCLTYAVFAYISGHAKFSYYLKIIPVIGAGELSVFLAAMIGAGLGFLWFNSYPAEVFMGDTGSLFLGGGIGLVAIIIKQELLLIIVGGIFVIETLSVLIQVISFRTTGRRIFKMSPLHHHFELMGVAEPKLVIRFWIISIILSLIALTALKIR